MLAVIGTVPDLTFPLISGPVSLEDGGLRIQDRCIPVNRGTPALLAAALQTAQVLGGMPITAFLAGDIGRGNGSRQLYQQLVLQLPQREFSVLAFHYLQPDVDWHNKVLFAIEAMPQRPLLIADAGFMYAAKMSGQAGQYDLFTPDVGELAFLADEAAPHPFYTRGFILHQDDQVPDLIARAYHHQNAARYLLVKGRTDYIADHAVVLDTIDQPVCAAMEAIGGTGDTLTGILAVLCSAGMPTPQAAALAAKTNRRAGWLAQPTPATQVGRLIEKIPEALSFLMHASQGASLSQKAGI